MIASNATIQTQHICASTIDEQCKWQILAPKFSKVQVLLQNVANSKEKCPRLKKQKQMQQKTTNPKTICTHFLFHCMLCSALIFFPSLLLCFLFLCCSTVLLLSFFASSLFCCSAFCLLILCISAAFLFASLFFCPSQPTTAPTTRFEHLSTSGYNKDTKATSRIRRARSARGRRATRKGKTNDEAD